MQVISSKGLWHIKQTQDGYIAWKFTGDGTMRITAASLEALFELLSA